MECLMKGNEMGVKDKIKRVMPQRIWNEIKSCTDKYYEGKMRKKCKLIEEFRPSESEFGVNLIGDIRAETGLGQSMRIIADMLEQAGIPFLVRQMDAPDNIEHQERKWDRIPVPG